MLSCTDMDIYLFTYMHRCNWLDSAYQREQENTPEYGVFLDENLLGWSIMVRTLGEVWPISEMSSKHVSHMYSCIVSFQCHWNHPLLVCNYFNSRCFTELYQMCKCLSTLIPALGRWRSCKISVKLRLTWSTQWVWASQDKMVKTCLKK